MAVIRWNFPNGSNGDALTAPLAGGDTTGLVGGVATLSNEQYLAGVSSLSAKFDSTVGGSLWYAKEGLSSTSFAYDFYMYIETRLGGTVYVAWAGASALSRALGVMVGGSQNRLILRDGAADVWQGAANGLPDDAWVRVSVFGTCGVGTGTARVVSYLGHSTTPLEDSGLLTGLSTQTSIDRIRMGGKAATTSITGGVVYFGSWAYDTAATGLIGPYSAGTTRQWYQRNAGAWAPVTAQKRESGSWSPKTTYLK